MKVAALSLLFCAAVFCYADSTKYIAKPQDTSLSKLIARWASSDRQSFKWEASFDVPINDVAAINSEAQLGQATAMDDALLRILDVEVKNAANPATLVACHFPDDDPSWVVRDSKQPPCDKPLK
ncbi:MAG: hypothetical protein JO218_12580 [Burkholderiales bacterium]|nr:hypothetical protein [Burkholderiales bacterium]